MYTLEAGGKEQGMGEEKLGKEGKEHFQKKRYRINICMRGVMFNNSILTKYRHERLLTRTFWRRGASLQAGAVPEDAEMHPQPYSCEIVRARAQRRGG